MCTPVHGLSSFSAIEQTESPCTGAHIFTVALQSRPIWLLYQYRPISICQLKEKALCADCLGEICDGWGVGLTQDGKSVSLGGSIDDL